jgi:peptide/nickel transport system substrate-binding protein
MAMRRLLTAVLLAWLAGCDQSPPAGLRFGLASAPLTLDPRFATDAAGERIGRLLFARLTDHDARGRAVPSLATWQQQTPTRYLLTLDPRRATFSDGRPLSAADVAATYSAVLDPALGSPHRDTLKHIVRVAALDNDHLMVTLDAPDLLLPGRLSLGILPAAQARQAQRLEHPIGSGPFALLGRNGNDLHLRRRRDGLALDFLTVADPTVRALKLVRGELDLVQNDLPPEIAAWLARQSGVRVERAAGDTFAYLGFNYADPLSGDPRVRRAIALAIDRAALIKYLFQGGAVPAESVLTPDHWAGDPDLVPVPHDPAAARALLAQLGHGPQHPLQLSYKTSADPFRLRLAAAIQAQLAAVGIALRIQSYDWGTFYGDIKAGRFQLYSLAWVGVKEPDILRHIFDSRALPPGGANRGRYASPLVDLALEAAARANNLTDMAAAYRAVQAQVHDDLVYVPLWYEQQLAALGPRVTGYGLRRDGAYDGLATVQLVTTQRTPRD